MAEDDQRTRVTLPPESLRRFRWIYLRDRIFEFMVGMSALAGSLIYLVEPSRFNDALVYQQISDSFGVTTAWIWNTAYGVGGACVAVGILRLDERMKAIGLALLCSTFAINFVSVLDDWDKLGHGTALQGGLAIACGMRFVYLMKRGPE